MKINKEMKKELARRQKEFDKFKKTVIKNELEEKLKCVTDEIMKNKELCDKICSMPNDEVKVVMNDIIRSTVFGDLFETSLNGPNLAALRASKAAKAEKRKHNSETTEQSDHPDNNY